MISQDLDRARKAYAIAKRQPEPRADYDMSKPSRFVRERTGLASNGSGADYHYRNEWAYYRDIEKARDMDRNDAIVGQIVDRATANIVQDGFVLDPKTGDKKLNEDLQARWNEWGATSAECDLTGEMTWHDIERHACRAQLVDGDICAAGLWDGCLQLIESHAVRGGPRENTVLGVEKSSTGQRVNYWVAQEPIEAWRSIGGSPSTPIPVYDRTGVRQLFHIYTPKRVSQTRGVTAFAPIFAVTGMFEDIQFAKLVQQQVVSCFAIFRKKTARNPDLPTTTPGYGSSTTETTSNSGTRYVENIAPGMEIVGELGEELQGFSPNVPNNEYFSHVNLTLQIIGVNLGLPLCLVLMDGSETNFSGWRGAVDEARKGFRAQQRNLINRLHSPVYHWKVRQWMSEDAALRAAAVKRKSAGKNILDHKWNAPRWGYIDPVGDAQGDALRLQNALTSPRRLHAERGGAWEEVAEDTIEDNALAIEQAMKRADRINKKRKEGPAVHWRELISLPMPSGIQMTMQDPNVVELQTSQVKEESENV